MEQVVQLFVVGQNVYLAGDGLEVGAEGDDGRAGLGGAHQVGEGGQAPLHRLPLGARGEGHGEGGVGCFGACFGREGGAAGGAFLFEGEFFGRFVPLFDGEFFFANPN